MYEVKESSDYAILDCMPSLGMVMINALACADSVLIPVQAAYLPVKGLQQLIKTIGRVQLGILGLIFAAMMIVMLASAELQVWIDLATEGLKKV